MSQYYALTLDTMSPQGYQIVATTPINGDCDIVINQNGDLDVNYMYFWVDKNEQGTDPQIEVDSSDWITFENTYTVPAAKFSTNHEGAQYVHGIFMDGVGNISAPVDSNKVVFDTTAPTIIKGTTEAPFSKTHLKDVSADTTAIPGHTISTSVALELHINDLCEDPADAETSGIDRYVITRADSIVGGPVQGSFTAQENEDSKTGEVTKGIALTLVALAEGVDEETRTISIVCYDKAGNQCASESFSIQLDTKKPEATFDLFQGSRNVNSGFVIPQSVVTVTMAQGSGTADIISYKLFGDFEGSDEEWHDWTPAGATSVSVDKTITALGAGDTVRNFTVIVRDNAGNEVPLGTKFVRPDGEVPTLTIDEIETNGAEGRMSANVGYNDATLTVTVKDDCQLVEVAGGDVKVDVYASNAFDPEAPETTVWTKVKTYTIPCKDKDGVDSLKDAEGQEIVVPYADLAAAGLTVIGDGVPVFFLIKAKDLAATTSDLGGEGESTPSLDQSVEIDTVAPDLKDGITLPTAIGMSNVPTFTDHAKRYTRTAGEQEAEYLAEYGFAAEATDEGLTPAAATLSCKAWIDNIENQTEVPGGATAFDYVATIPASNVYFATPSQSAKPLYLHIEFTDDVDNKRIVTSNLFAYDVTVPATTGFSCSNGSASSAATSRQSTVNFTYADDDVAHSGVKAFKLYGDITASDDPDDVTAITEEEADWITTSGETILTTNIFFTPNPVDDTDAHAKTIRIKVVDYAGNVSSERTTTGYLESEDPTVSLVLLDESGEVISKSDEGTCGQTGRYPFKAQVVITEHTQNTSPYRYKLTGDMRKPYTNWEDVTAETVEKTDTSGNKYWETTFIVDTYKSEALKFTEANGIKTIRLDVEDKNGNKGTVNASTNLDREVAIINVKNEKGSRISLSHTKRRVGSYGPTTDEKRFEDDTLINYNDLSYFEFTWTKPIIEYKVCVNTGVTAEQFDDDDKYQAAVEALKYIGKDWTDPNTACRNMYWKATGTESRAANTDNPEPALINANPFADDPAVDHQDNAYEVIIYAKSQAKLWSAGHAFTIPKRAMATGTAVDKDGNPVSVDIINADVSAEAKAAGIPEGAVAMRFGTNSDVRNAKTFTLTADVSELKLEDGDTVDVYHFE